MTLRAVIVDDELAGRRAVRESCRSCADIEILAECDSGAQAIEVIRENRPQVAFLDIQMKPLTGIDVAAHLSAEETPVIVFVTAFDQYAIRAFELNAVDYLLKPFDAERFAVMMKRVRARVLGSDAPDARLKLRELLMAAAKELKTSARPGEEQRLIIEVGGRVTFLDPHEVEYVEVDRNYVTLSVGQHSYRVRATLAEIQARLTLPRFVRIQRSVIINTARTRFMEKWFHGEYLIEMQSGRRFTSGRTFRHRIQGMLLRARGENE